MMKRKQLLAGNIIGILLILFVIIAGKISISVVIKSFSTIITPADIGVIGGADGPTSIFVSGGFNINTVLFTFLAALLLIAVILVLNVLYLRTGRK
ncbi:MAG: sodium ion-translocating decarboxylase subunit beta [Bacteroidales bacterium]|nr:sodium ion-translocating decarboxylase subunit beta [Bacteroidales bacterium]